MNWRLAYDKGTVIGARHNSGITVDRVHSPTHKTSRGLIKGGTEYQVIVGNTRFIARTVECAIEWADEQILR